MKRQFFKMLPFNFVPFMKTPWAGKKISILKQKYFPEFKENIPEIIGESWEISTDLHFPSYILNENQKHTKLTEVLNENPNSILGKGIAEKYGSHSPLLLKLLNANDNLSVQLHPRNGNPLLRDDECGKPESWLVLEVEEHGYVYLGFKDHLTKEQIQEYLLNDQPEKCLHKYKPKKFDYISVPPGCVHAVGPGVFLAEPQYVLPNKSGKTWRLSDWQRLYDANGQRSDKGKPRELHIKESLNAIDWNLPRGIKIEQMLVQNMLNGVVFYGNQLNPFSLQVFYEPQNAIYVPLEKNAFSLATVWGGQVILKSENDTVILQGGESVLISAEVDRVSLVMSQKQNENPQIAFFALNHEVV